MRLATRARQPGIPALATAGALVVMAWWAVPIVAQVGQDGAYSTRVRIDVPAFHGLEPELSLSYSSNGGNGNVGTGWALQASSTIERASPGRGAPRYDASDIFLLDGMELVPCGPGSQSPSCRTAVAGTHSTKIENYEKIRYEASNNTWMIWAKDGTRSVYTPFEQGAGWPTPAEFSNTFRWRLDSVFDTHLNQVSYRYACSFAAGAQCYLDTISYGDSIACEVPPPSPPDTPAFKPRTGIPGVEIKFFWEGRSDGIYYGNGRGLSAAVQRLKSVRIRSAGWTNKAYVLDYVTSAVSGRSLLAQLQQFGTDVVLCENPSGCGGIDYGAAMPLPAPTRLPALHFSAPAMNGSANTWTPTQTTSGMSLASTVYGTAAFSGLTDPDDGKCATPCRVSSCFIGLRCLSGDVNNDRRLDEVCGYSANDLGNVRTVVSLSTTSGFTQVSNTDAGLGDILTDMNGDGRDDIFTGPSSCSPVEITGGYCPKRSISVRLLTGDKSFEAPGGDFGEMPWPFLDVGPRNLFDYAVTIYGSFYKGLDAKFAVPAAGAPDVQQQWFTGDVNADGMADFIYVYRTPATNLANLCTALSTGTGTFNFLPCQTSVWNWYDNRTNHSRFLPADVNGDGRVDVVHVAFHPGGIERGFAADHSSIEVAISRGDGTYAFTTDHEAAAWLDDSVWLPGDINGDGKTDIVEKLRHPADAVRNVDHVFAKVGISLGDGRFRWIGTDAGFPWTETTGTTTQAPFYLADMTGDGRADLVGLWTTGATVSSPRYVAMTPSGLNDQFGATQFFFQTLVTQPGQTNQGGSNVGDVNGDGKADVVTHHLVNTTIPPSAGCQNDIVKVAYAAYLSKSENVDLQNITAIDQDGDGRSDLVYVYFTNPGYKITTFLRNSVTATYNRVEALFSPGDIPGVTTPLDNPDTGAWMRADVGGGPEAMADGKVDLVQVEHSGSTLRIYTLISAGGGAWTRKFQSFPITTQFMPNYVAQSWLSADVNGDGRADLLHVSRRVRQVQVDTLLSNGDGTWNWTPSSTYFADFYPDDVLFLSWYAGKRLPWMATDVNGDGKADLIYVKDELDPFSENAQRTVVYSLISHFDKGNTSYTPAVSANTFRFADTQNWRPVDVNGDGLSDLVYISKPVDAPGLTLNYLLSLGNGTFTPVAPLGPFTAPPALRVDDTQNFKAVDVNGDGKVDFVHVSSYLDSTGIETGVFTLLNQYPGAVAAAQLKVSPFYRYQDARSWMPMDADSDGKADLVYVSPDINVLRFDASDDRLSSHQNGLLGDTAIHYKPSAGLHVNLPPGSLVWIADYVEQTDGVSAGTYRTDYSYTDARWSYGERTFLGFAGTEARDGHSILSTSYDQGDACGSRALSLISKDTAGKILREQISSYAPLSAGALPPYDCTLAVQSDNECEGVSPCLENKTEFVRDGYGTVVETLLWGRPGADDDRRIATPSSVNTADYIVGLPAERSLYDGSKQLQASKKYVYDQPATSDWTQPPGPKAEVTKTLDWNSDTGLYVTTAYEHDAQGNQTLVTDPVGSYAKTSYDCNYNRYPVSVCNNLNCTATTWNLALGVMTSIVDANRQTTSYDYDALSRRSKTTYPDKSYVAAFFLDYGSPLQRDRAEVSDESKGQWAGFRWTENYFDGLGRTYKTASEGALPTDAEVLVRQYTFEDTSNRIVTESNQFTSAEVPVWTTHSYDGLKRRIDTVLPGGTFHRRTTYLQGSEQRFDELGHMRELFHDAAGNIVRVRERHQTFVNNSEGGAGRYEYYDTDYTYDANQRLTMISDSQHHKSSTVYNSLGWKLRNDDWDLGQSDFTYRPDGSVATEADARKFSKEYTYDSVGRTTVTKYRNQTGMLTRTITQSYDRDPATGLTQGASIGRLTQISDTTADYKGCYQGHSAGYTPIGVAPTHTIESCLAGALAGGYGFAALESGGACYGGGALPAPVAESECSIPCTANSAEVCGGANRGSIYGTGGSKVTVDAAWYDTMGRAYQQQRCIDGTCSSMSSTFDLAGRLKTLTYPDGETLTSNYNGAGQLSGLSKYLTSAVYNSQGQPIAETYANSMTTVRTYDALRFWPESMAVRPARSIRKPFWYRVKYAYDGAGRMKTRQQSAPVEDTAYQYDDLNRLMTVASVSTPSLVQSFDYDQVGNLLFNSKTGFYNYLPSHPHAVSSTVDPVLGGTYSYGHDANGNTDSSLTNQLTWDNDNRLTRDYNTVTGQTTSYSYDLGGQRVSKTTGGSTRNYFSRYIETSPSGTTKYYYAGDRLIASRDPSGVYATSLTFSWAVAGCGGSGAPYMAFKVNNSLALSTGAAGACACTVQIMSETVSDPVVLARVNDVATGSNTFSLEVPSSAAMVAWAKVAVNVPGQAPYELIIVDHLGGDDAVNNNPVICGTQRGDQTIPGPGTWSVADPRNYNLITYYHQDHLGSTRVVTDRKGATLYTNSYAPFGTATPGQRFGFAGAESDDETGLLYMKARYLSPTLGRMLSADSEIPDLFNPQSLNRYSYVLNNPLMYSDPSGHAPEGSDPSEWAPWPYRTPALRMAPLEFQSRRALSDPPLVAIEHINAPEDRAIERRLQTLLQTQNVSRTIDRRLAQLLKKSEGPGAQWDDLVEKSSALLADPVKLQRLGDAAIATGENAFHITVGMYEAVLSGHSWLARGIGAGDYERGWEHQMHLYRELPETRGKAQGPEHPGH
jgi:RHS repeat-associated protein